MAKDRSRVVSSFTIVKGSLIEATYSAFATWDLTRSKRDNIRQMKDSNSIGGSSEAWLRDVGKVLNRRFDPGGRDRALVLLAQLGGSLEVFKPALLWHMTRDEYLVRDFLVNWLYQRFAQGVYLVHSDDVVAYLQDMLRQGLASQQKWTRPTIERVAVALLRMAVDFDLMTATVARQFASYHLPDQALLYLLHAMVDALPSTRHVLQAEDWKLFLLDQAALERELLRLHQFRELHYQVAGSLVELKLPCRSADEYVRRLCA